MEKFDIVKVEVKKKKGQHISAFIAVYGYWSQAFKPNSNLSKEYFANSLTKRTSITVLFYCREVIIEKRPPDSGEQTESTKQRVL